MLSNAPVGDFGRCLLTTAEARSAIHSARASWGTPLCGFSEWGFGTGGAVRVPEVLFEFASTVRQDPFWRSVQFRHWQRRGKLPSR